MLKIRHYAKPQTVSGNSINTKVEDNIRADLSEFIQQRIGPPDLILTRASPVEQTLGMAELDTILFYNEFVKQFKIHIPPDWDIGKHVSPVVLHSWRHYVQRLFSKTYRKQTNYRDLTVGELEAMIETGVWQLEK